MAFIGKTVINKLFVFYEQSPRSRKSHSDNYSFSHFLSQQNIFEGRKVVLANGAITFSMIDSVPTGINVVLCEEQNKFVVNFVIDKNEVPLLLICGETHPFL